MFETARRQSGFAGSVPIYRPGGLSRHGYMLLSDGKVRMRLTHLYRDASYSADMTALCPSLCYRAPQRILVPSLVITARRQHARAQALNNPRPSTCSKESGFPGRSRRLHKTEVCVTRSRYCLSSFRKYDHLCFVIMVSIECACIFVCAHVGALSYGSFPRVAQTACGEIGRLKLKPENI